MPVTTIEGLIEMGDGAVSFGGLLDAPIDLAPVNGISYGKYTNNAFQAGHSWRHEDITFSWRIVTGATFYVLQICRDSGFRSSTLQSFRVVSNISAPIALERRVGITYYWRVFAYGNNGAASEASETFSFSLDWLDPNLVRPDVVAGEYEPPDARGRDLVDSVTFSVTPALYLCNKFDPCYVTIDIRLKRDVNHPGDPVGINLHPLAAAIGDFTIAENDGVFYVDAYDIVNPLYEYIPPENGEYSELGTHRITLALITKSDAYDRGEAGDKCELSIKFAVGKISSPDLPTDVTYRQDIFIADRPNSGAFQVGLKNGTLSVKGAFEVSDGIGSYRAPVAFISGGATKSLLSGAGVYYILEFDVLNTISSSDGYVRLFTTNDSFYNIPNPILPGMFYLPVAYSDTSGGAGIQIFGRSDWISYQKIGEGGQAKLSKTEDPPPIENDQPAPPL